MIKQTIEISRQPAHLSSRLEQLVIQPFEQDKSAARTIPCEDIGVVVVDHPKVTWSHHALAKLVESGAVVVVCGPKHLPAGILMPMPEHSEVVCRIHDQIAATQPTQKRLWQQVVRAKIRAQAENLAPGTAAYRRLRALVKEVRSGDGTNVEAQAARVYWQALFASDGRGSVKADQSRFRRDIKGGDPVNVMLNYGYAILRAAMARAIVAAGLAPAVGIHHHHRANAFCLADDLIEPLRPMVDARVRERWLRGQDQLDQPTKAHLLHVLVQPVCVREDSGPLMIGLSKMVASLVRCLRGEERHLCIPQCVKDQGADSASSIPDSDT